MPSSDRWDESERERRLSFQVDNTFSVLGHVSELRPMKGESPRILVVENEEDATHLLCLTHDNSDSW